MPTDNNYLVVVVLPVLDVPLRPDDPLVLVSVDPLLPEVLAGVLLELLPVSEAPLAPEEVLLGVLLEAPLAPDVALLPVSPLVPELPLAAPAPPAAAAALVRFFSLDTLFFGFCFFTAFFGEASSVPEAPDVPDADCSCAILRASASTAAARAGSVLSVTPVEEVCATLMPARDMSETNTAKDTFFISISI